MSTSVDRLAKIISFLSSDGLLMIRMEKNDEKLTKEMYLNGILKNSD